MVAGIGQVTIWDTDATTTGSGLAALVVTVGGIRDILLRV